MAQANLFATKRTRVSWDPATMTTWTDYHKNGQEYDVFATSNFDTMDKMFIEGLKRHPDKCLLVDEDGRRMSFQETLDAAQSLANTVRSEFELERNARVGICGRNSVDWVLSFIAVSLAGFIVVPMNSWWTPRELEYAIKLTDCKLIFADGERANRILQINKIQCTIVRIESKWLSSPKLSGLRNIEDLILAGRTMKSSNSGSVHTDAPAMIMFTSGTTSFPKGVVLTHRGICHTANVYDKNLTAAKAMFPNLVDQPSAILMNVPLFHATGLYAIFFASILVGRKVVLMRKWVPERALQLIQDEKVTAFTGVPSMVADILSHPALEKYDITSLKAVGSGGAPPPEGIAKAIASKLKAIPGQGFGLTEVNCLATTISAQDYLARPGSCGKGVPGIEIQIWPENSDGPNMHAGGYGRVAIRGPTVMLEYWRDSEATAKAITKDGWFVTGDFGHMDKDGFLYISGRSQDLIIRGGENISARAVEEAIFAQFDSIQECAVFAYPHPKLGEEVGAAITMKSGHSAPTLGELRTRCAAVISPFMLPTGLAVFQQPLPRGATGKTVKKDIKELLKNGRLPSWTTLTKEGAEGKSSKL